MKIGFIGFRIWELVWPRAVLQTKTGADLLLANRSQVKVDAFSLPTSVVRLSSNEKICRSRCDFLGLSLLNFLNCFLNTRLSLKKRKSSFDFHGSWIDLGKTG